MGKTIFNPITGKLDYVEDPSDYVKKTGDTMTGELINTPASGDNSLTANKDVVIKSGQKLYLDGS